MSWSICTENFASLKQAAISKMLCVSYVIGCCSDISPWLRYSNLVCSALRRVHLFRPQIHLLEKLSLKRGVRKNMQLAEKLNNSKHQIQKSHLRFWIFPLTWKHFFPVCSPILNTSVRYCFWFSVSRVLWVPEDFNAQPIDNDEWESGALAVPVSSTGLSTVATPCSSFDA